MKWRRLARFLSRAGSRLRSLSVHQGHLLGHDLGRPKVERCWRIGGDAGRRVALCSGRHASSQAPSEAQMADVRIRYSPDRTAAAERLREAISAAGYAVASDQISDLDDLIAGEDRHRAGMVNLLIWSRPLLSSGLRPGLLRKLRQQRNLIQVSADGVGPQAADGDDHVILISGWRGQPFHPGWQRIASDLKRLCGPGTLAVETEAGSGQLGPPAGSQPMPAEGAISNWWPSVRGLVLALLAAAGLFGAGYGISRWIGNDASGPQQPPAAPIQTRKAERAPAAGQPGIAADVGIGEQSVPPSANPGLASPEPATVEPRQIQASPTPAPASPAARKPSKATSRQATAEIAPRPTRGRSQMPNEKKRYSRANSRTMRLFCEGSGRSTPQCRTFLRSAGGSVRRLGPE